MACWLSRNLNLAYIFQEKATCAATKHQLHVLNSKGDLGGVSNFTNLGKNLDTSKKSTTQNCEFEDDPFVFVSDGRSQHESKM